MTRPVLQVVIASTRPGRNGPAFARWFVDLAQQEDLFDIEVVDLAQVALPFMDEPYHPRLHRYQHQHTKDWSATVERADAFVFVTPEYNYGYNAVLKNALDYLHDEWADKPVGFLSYGGVAAGTRAVQQLKQVVTALRMVPVVESVNVPFAAQFLDADHEVRANDAMVAGARGMTRELARLAVLLRRLPVAV